MTREYKYIDLTYLEGIAEGDKDIIKELVEIFLDQMPEFIDGFAENVRDKNWIKIAAIAHKAKSSVMSMGMDELGNIDLKNLELLSKQLRILELKAKESITNVQIEEVKSLERNLEGYPEDRVNWVIENANKETLYNLIEKFTSICLEAVEELKNEISMY